MPILPNFFETADSDTLNRRWYSKRNVFFVILICFSIFFVSGHTVEKNRQVVSIATPEKLASSTPFVFPKVQLEAKAVIVYDLLTGETLFEKNSNAQLPLASLTKILTIYAALKELDPSSIITISDNASKVVNWSMFYTGQKFRLDELSRLTLTASLNEGAIAISETVVNHSKNKQSLASAVTALGLSQTFAVNGSGLDENEKISGAYGSAHDIARLSGALVMEAPDIANATTHTYTNGISVDGTSYTVRNTNPVVNNLPRLLLSKTGFTDIAVGNLALVFDAGISHPIAVVVLGSSETGRFKDGTSLVNATIKYFSSPYLL